MPVVDRYSFTKMQHFVCHFGQAVGIQTPFVRICFYFKLMASRQRPAGRAPATVAPHLPVKKNSVFRGTIYRSERAQRTQDAIDSTDSKGYNKVSGGGSIPRSLIL